MIRAVLFDAWGTLYTNAHPPRPFSEFTRLLGCSFEDPGYLECFEQHFCLDTTGNLRRVTSEFLEDLGKRVDEATFAEAVHQQERSCGDIVAFPDVAEALADLRRDHRLGLISNSGIRGAEALRETMAVDEAFPAVVFSYELQVLKPDPRALGSAVGALGCEPAEVLMVGDSRRGDYEGALAFGMNALLVDRKCRPSNQGFYRVTSLAALRDAIRKRRFAEANGSGTRGGGCSPGALQALT